MIHSTELTILMVEDNPGDQFLLEELLLSSGIKIRELFTVESIKQAHEVLKSEAVDIILLDLSLPDSFGINSFTSIRENAGYTPIVILSGVSDMNTALDAITLGAQDYLIKGDFDEKLLSKTILYSIERMNNLQALQESNERYDLVSKATNDMVWDLNLQTGEVYRNPEGWKKIFKTDYNPIQFGSEEKWVKQIHPSEREDVIKKINQFKENPSFQQFELEYRFLRADGDYAYLQDRGYIIRNEQGKAVRFIGATQDITPRKEAERILKESEEQYRYLFENNPAAIIIWSLKDFTVLEINESTEKHSGYKREDLKGKSILTVGLAERVELVHGLAEKALKDKSFRETHITRIISKWGDKIYIEFVSHRIDYMGMPCIMALGNNVTERVMLEKQLEAERVKAQKEMTNAVISAQESERQEIGRELHDNINQILASARLYLGLGKTAGDSQSLYLGKSDELIQSAIDEIRTLSHSLIPPTLSEGHLKDNLLQLFENVASGIGTTIYHNMTELEEQFMEDNFKLAIYRICQEQFNNITKYAKANTINFYLGNRNGNLELSIKDDGIGFDKAKKSNGVGLMNMKTRAALFNGTIEINTAPGKGCELVVQFKLPVLEQIPAK
ncbi:PAS domain S-box protein [Flavihumibacter sp. RY-1]|uniref:histidine kinase n=1 Tax=Flavihumibacter fluminis TaxID=2909236 RepID=A0ABS9BKT1_9BACT|nr:PAS domain S-box protein [Flavihumibacter fluminis]MCF1716307.1 PAS domain S-box protein [Flavihumibacter fluminis]